MQTGIPFNKPLIAGKGTLLHCPSGRLWQTAPRTVYQLAVGWIEGNLFLSEDSVQEGPGGLVNENFAYSTKHSIEEA
jgi:hypothetical protein